VYNFSRSLSDDVHAQQFQRIRVKQNFQKPLIVAQHLALRQFGTLGIEVQK